MHPHDFATPFRSEAPLTIRSFEQSQTHRQVASREELTPAYSTTTSDENR